MKIGRSFRRLSRLAILPPGGKANCIVVRVEWMVLLSTEKAL